jgi:hypothetical protein
MPAKRKIPLSSSGGVRPGKAAKTDQATVPDAKGQTYATASMNTHMVKVLSACTTIFGNEHFKDIKGAAPLRISQGGKEEPYSFGQCKVVHTKDTSPGTALDAGGNFFWQDFATLSSHRVPMNQGQVKYIQTKFPPLKPPSRSPYRTSVAISGVADDECAGGDDVKLQVLSPLEISHAVLFSLQDAITLGASDEVLRGWKALVLSWPMSWEAVPLGEARTWRASNLREIMVDAGDSVKLSTRQLAMEVAGFKSETEANKQTTMSSADTAKLYATHLVQARSSEQISPTFIDSAITVVKRVINIPECATLLEWCDENFLDNTLQHPFNSIYALQSVCDRAQLPHLISWSLDLLVDHYRMEFIDIGFFSVRKLKDTKESYVIVWALVINEELPGKFLF